MNTDNGIYEPTARLRFIRRTVVGGRELLILQQLWAVQKEYGFVNDEWCDVPVEDAEEEKWKP